MSYIAQVKEYQNFNSHHEMDAHFEKFRKLHRFKITKTENEVLFTLKAHAVKVPGAVKIKLETLAKEVGTSLTSVKRGLAKGIELGIIKRFKTRKENGSKQGATVYQFQHFSQQDGPLELGRRENAENPRDSKDEAAKNEPESLIPLSPSSSFKDTNITGEHTQENKVDKELYKKNGLLAKIPNALRGLSVFFDNSQDIYDMVGVIFRAKAKISRSIKIEEHEPAFRAKIASVYESWKRAVEKGDVDYNVFGLMTKAIKEMCVKILDGSLYETKPPVTTRRKLKFSNIPDWMEFDEQVYTNFVNTPHWMENRNQPIEAPMEVPKDENIDFEAERQKVLAKVYG